MTWFESSPVSDSIELTSSDFTVNVYRVYPPIIDTDEDISAYDWVSPTRCSDFVKRNLPFVTYLDTLNFTTGTNEFVWDCSPHVDTSGKTTFLFVSSRSVNALAPVGNEYVLFDSSETTSDPYLLIEYLSPVTPGDVTLTMTGIPSDAAFGTIPPRALDNIAPGYIESPLGTLYFSPDTYQLLENTDLGLAQSSASEVANVGRDINIYSSGSYNLLRLLYLRIRVRGADLDEVVGRVHTLQSVVTSGEDFYFFVSDTEGWTKFRVKRCISFDVPDVRTAQTHTFIDLGVEFEAEPFAQGEVQEPWATPREVTTPGETPLGPLAGNFVVPLKVTLTNETSKMTQAYVTVVDETVHWRELKVVETATGTDVTLTASGSRSSSGKALVGGPAWHWACWSRDAHGLAPDTYRVLARVCDRTIGPKPEMRISMAAVDTDRSDMASFSAASIVNDKRPSYYSGIIFGDAGQYGWAWVDLGPWQQERHAGIGLWVKGTLNQFVDSLIFLPTKYGVIGWGSSRWQVSVPTVDSLASEYIYDTSNTYYDGTPTRCGTTGGRLVAPVSGAARLVIVAANDADANVTSPTWTTNVTVEYVPRYAALTTT